MTNNPSNIRLTLNNVESYHQSIQNAVDNCEGSGLVEILDGIYKENLHLRHDCNFFLHPSVTLIGRHSDFGRTLTATFSGNGILKEIMPNSKVFEITNPASKIIVNCNFAEGSTSASVVDNLSIFSNQESSFGTDTLSIATTDTNWIHGQNHTISGNVQYGVLSGTGNTLGGNFAQVFGIGNRGIGQGSFVSGSGNLGGGFYSDVGGISNTGSGQGSFSRGQNNLSQAQNSHTEGDSNRGEGLHCHLEGNLNQGIGNFSHGEGLDNRVIGIAGHVEGTDNSASANSSHSSGHSSIALIFAQYAHGGGRFIDKSDAQYSRYILRVNTTNAATQPLLIDGNYLTLNTSNSNTGTNRSYAGRYLLVARQVGGTAGSIGDTECWKGEGHIKVLSGSPSITFTDTRVSSDLFTPAWTVVSSVTASPITAVYFNVTGQANKTINWVMTLDCTETCGYTAP